MITRWLHFNKPYDEKVEDMIHLHKKNASVKEENPSSVEAAEIENTHEENTKSEQEVERKVEH